MSDDDKKRRRRGGGKATPRRGRTRLEPIAGDGGNVNWDRIYSTGAGSVPIGSTLVGGKGLSKDYFIEKSPWDRYIPQTPNYPGNPWGNKPPGTPTPRRPTPRPTPTPTPTPTPRGQNTPVGLPPIPDPIPLPRSVPLPDDFDFTMPQISPGDFTDQGLAIAARALAPYLAVFDQMKKETTARGELLRGRMSDTWDQFGEEIKKGGAETNARYEAANAQESQELAAQKAAIQQNYGSSAENLMALLTPSENPNTPNPMAEKIAAEQGVALTAADTASKSEQDYNTAQQLSEADYNQTYGNLMQQQGIYDVSELDRRTSDTLLGIGYDQAEAVRDQQMTGLDIARAMTDRDLQSQQFNAGMNWDWQNAVAGQRWDRYDAETSAAQQAYENAVGSQQQDWQNSWEYQKYLADYQKDYDLAGAGGGEDGLKPSDFAPGSKVLYTAQQLGIPTNVVGEMNDAFLQYLSALPPDPQRTQPQIINGFTDWVKKQSSRPGSTLDSTYLRVLANVMYHDMYMPGGAGE